MKKIIFTWFMLIFLFCSVAIGAEQNSYKPARVVYDVSSQHVEELKNILDRVSLLQNIYGNDPFESSIILVIHEQAIPFFTRNSANLHKDIEQRAASLAAGEIIQFRVCRASARMQRLGDKDFNSFISLVPMADAEIIKLQNEGYAYLK